MDDCVVDEWRAHLLVSAVVPGVASTMLVFCWVRAFTSVDLHAFMHPKMPTLVRLTSDPFWIGLPWVPDAVLMTGSTSPGTTAEEKWRAAEVEKGLTWRRVVAPAPGGLGPGFRGGISDTTPIGHD